MLFHSRRYHHSLTAFQLTHTYARFSNINMSVKMKDVLNVFRQNKLDRALGLLEHPSQYRNSNPLLQQNDPSYVTLKSSRKQYQDSFVNIARTEDGTTFYMRQKVQ